MGVLAVDLYCGLGGWAEGFLSEGYDVVGFDIERHDYGTGGYPGQLVIQDVLTLHGSQFRNATVFVASPPCQKYSYMAMPWSRAKKLALWYYETIERVNRLNALFDACFRIQREASEAAGRYIPLIVENVKGAQPWVGRAKWHYGSFYLWGDVPALMPITLGARKVPGMNFHEHEKTGKPGRSFQTAAVEHTKIAGQNWSNFKAKGIKVQGIKVADNKFGWDGTIMTQGTSHGAKRKAASAEIAKIPFPLAQHIARCFAQRPEKGLQ